MKPTGHCTAASSEHWAVLEASLFCLTEPAAGIASSKMPLLPEKPPFFLRLLVGRSSIIPTQLLLPPFSMLRLGPKILTPGPTFVLSGLIPRTVLLIWHLPALLEAAENILFLSLAPGVGHLWQSIGLGIKVIQSETLFSRRWYLTTDDHLIRKKKA